jgi:hypothetical protein
MFKFSKIIFGALIVAGALIFILTAGKAAGCPLKIGIPLKTSGSKAVCQITKNCAKQIFDSEAKYFSYHSDWKQLAAVDAKILANVAWDAVKIIPWGPRYAPAYGALLKTVDSPKIYFVAGGQKRWIENEKIFNALKLPWSWTENAVQEVLQSFPEGAAISSQTYPNYLVFKYAVSSKVYRVEPDHFDYQKQVKRWIKDEKEFKELGLRWDRILTIDDAVSFSDSQNKAGGIYQGIKCSAAREFNVLVFFDDASATATDAEISAALQEASEHLYARTCIKLNVLKIWRVQNSSDPAKKDTALAEAYPILKQNPDLVKKANGFVYFTENPTCSDTYGGCAITLTPAQEKIGISDYCNTFSNIYGQTGLLFGSYVDWDHMFGRCGYNDNEEKVSDKSFGGECQNQDGVSCVKKFDYYMCSNLTGEYYAQSRRMMAISTVVHEIMHHYGVKGNYDHNEKAEHCKQSYKNTLDDFICADGDIGNCFFNICRYTYENFMKAEDKCKP